MHALAIPAQARAGTAEALLAVGIRSAWLVPSVAAGTPRVVIAAVQPDLMEMADLYDAYDQMTCLEWVLQEVHQVPVTVRLYFSAAAVPPSAVPIFPPTRCTGTRSSPPRRPCTDLDREPPWSTPPLPAFWGTSTPSST